MSKRVPQQSPLYYYEIEQASYDEQSTAFLAKRMPNVELLEETSISGWKYILVKEKSTGELTMACKGTEPDAVSHPIRCLKNWGSNVYRQIFKPYAEIEKVKSIVDQWQSLHGNISTCVSHSGGSFLARHLNKGIIFINFNPHKPVRGRNIINLSKAGDCVSQFGLISVPERCIVVDPHNKGCSLSFEAHKLGSFEQDLKGKSWNDLSEKLKEQRALHRPIIEEFHSSYSRFESEFQKETEEVAKFLGKIPDTSNENPSVDEIESQLSSCPPEVLVGQLEKSADSGENVKECLDAEWEKAVREKKTEAILSCVNDMAIEIYRDQQRAIALKQRRSMRRAWENDSQKHIQRLKSSHYETETNLTLPQIQHSLLSSFHPSGSVAQRFRAMRSSIQEYRKTHAELNQLLEQRRSRKGNLDGVEKNLHHLDVDIQRHYQKLLKSQESMVGAFGKASTALNITSSLLSVIPGGQAPAAGLKLAGTVADIGSSVLGHQVNRKEAKYRKKMGKNLDVREQLAAAASKNEQELAAILANRSQLRSQLKGMSQRSIPSQYREAVGSALKELETEISEASERFDQKNKKCAHLQKTIDQLKKQEEELIRALPHAHKSKQKKKEQLQKTRQLLAQKQTELIVEQQNVDALKSQTDQLENEHHDFQKIQEKEERLAPIKDFLHEAVQEEVKKWETADHKVKEWRETLEKGLADYSQARDMERQVVENIHSTLASLCSEVANSPLTPFLSYLAGKDISQGTLQAKTSIGILQQGYKIYDQYKSWSLAKKGIDETLAKLRETNPNASMIDVIDQLGMPFFMTQYILPGFQMITIGLTIVRMSSYFMKGSPRIESREETLLKNLGIFLQSLSKNMSLEFEGLHKRLDRDHQELIDVLSVIRTEAGTLHKEVLEEICSSKDEVLNELKLAAYNERTIEAKKKAHEIVTMNQTFSANLQKLSSTEEKKSHIRESLQTCNRAILSELDFEIYGGTSVARGEKGIYDAHDPLVAMSLIHRNPEIYTGILGASLGMDQTPTSLYLLIPMLDLYLNIKREARKAGINVDEDQELNNLGDRLLKKAEEILNLTSRLDQVVEQVRSHQDQVFANFESRMKKVQNIKAAYRDKLLTTSMNCHAKTLDEMANGKSIAGSKRFRYGQSLLTDPIDLSLKPQFTGRRGEYLREGAIGSLIGTAFGSALYIPAGLFFGISAPVSFTATAALSLALNMGGGVFGYTEHERQRPPDSLLKKSVKELSNSSQEQLEKIKFMKLHLWLNQNGEVMNKIFWSLNYGPFIPINPDVEIDATSPLNFTVKIFEDRVETDSKGLITNDDLNLLDKTRHSPPERYQESVQNLCRDYSEWIKSKQSETIELSHQPFSSLDSISTMIPSKSKGLVPLAFPSKMVESIRSQLQSEINQMEATGIGTLLPFYEVTECEKTGATRIKIHFDFIDNEQLENRIPYAEFTVAEVDPETINSFAIPTFRDTQPVNKPNLNEVLLQLMYSNLYPNLGLPDHESVKIGNKKWLIPTNRAFPGLFALWNQEPSHMIQFNLHHYTEDVQSDLELLIDGKPVKGECFRHLLQQRAFPTYSMTYMDTQKKIRAGKTLEKEVYSKLQKQYNLLWSYCCLLSSIDNETLRTLISRHLGILHPSQFHSIFDRISVGMMPAQINEESMTAFEELLRSLPSAPLNDLEELLALSSL